MDILYIDESGSPNKNAEIRYFSMVGFDVSLTNLRNLIHEYLKLHHHYYPELYRERIRDLLFKDGVKVLEKRECKYILNPKQYCHRSKMFMLNLIDLCRKFDGKTFGIVVELDKLKKEPSASWVYPYCMHTMTKVYCKFLKKKQSEGIFILDSRDQPTDDLMSLAQSRFLLFNIEGKKCYNIATLPFFTRSHISVVMQIAHFFSYITNMQYHFIKTKDKRYKHIPIFWQRLAYLFYGMPSRGSGPFIVWDDYK